MARPILTVGSALLVASSWGIAGAGSRCDAGRGSPADGGNWSTARGERGDADWQLTWPVATGQEPRTLFEQRLERIGVGRESLQGAAAFEPDVAESCGDASSLGLVGNDFPWGAPRP